MIRPIRTAALGAALAMCFPIIAFAQESGRGSGDYLTELRTRIAVAKEQGGNVKITREDGINALPLEIIQLAAAENVTLEMEYTYEGADYMVDVPGAAAIVDESIPIYGPLYLAGFYGKWHTVKKGDTLSEIAKAYKTTTANIMALNPEIQDADKIYFGRRIRVR